MSTAPPLRSFFHQRSYASCARCYGESSLQCMRRSAREQPLFPHQLTSVRFCSVSVASMNHATMVHSIQQPIVTAAGDIMPPAWAHEMDSLERRIRYLDAQRAASAARCASFVAMLEHHMASTSCIDQEPPASPAADLPPRRGSSLTGIPLTHRRSSTLPSHGDSPEYPSRRRLGQRRHLSRRTRSVAGGAAIWQSYHHDQPSGIGVAAVQHTGSLPDIPLISFEGNPGVIKGYESHHSHAHSSYGYANGESTGQEGSGCIANNPQAVSNRHTVHRRQRADTAPAARRAVTQSLHDHHGTV